MRQEKYPSIWRFLFLVTLFISISIIGYMKYTEIQNKVIVEDTYIFQDVIDNKQYYIMKNNRNITEYTENALSTGYNTSVANVTKNLNVTNAIYLYRYVRRHLTFGEPKRPIEVLERGRGEPVALHALLASMYLTMRGSNDIYLLLTQQPVDHSAVILLMNGTTHYFDLTRNISNLTYANPIEIMTLGNDIGAPTLRFRYIVGVEEVSYFKRDTDMYFWLDAKYEDNGW